MTFSKIQLGTVQFGLDYGIANNSGRPAYETVKDIVAAAFESGVNTLDTAASYGESEKVLGRALEDLELREKVQVISKIPPISQQNLSESEAEKFIHDSVETSLERLGVQRLAAALFHREEDFKYIKFLQKLEAEGMIGGAGVSLDSDVFCDAVVEAGIKFVQLPYNVLEHRFDRFLEQAQAQGTEVFARSIYLQGLLLMPEAKINPALNEVIQVRRMLEQKAEAAGIAMAELCVRFALSNPAITSVLTGVDNLEQLRQNVALFRKGPLPLELYREIRTAVPHLEEKLIRPALWKTFM